MTIGKAAAFGAALVGAMALGVIVGPSITNRGDVTTTTAPQVAVAPAPEVPVPAPAPSRRVIAERRAEVKVRENLAAMSSASPELHARLKPVLNRGTKMDLASGGFANAEQFAMVAHAAKNTGVPFAVLKHRVLDEGKTLAAAIRESNPDLDAAAEVRKARAAARDDLREVAPSS